MKKQLLGSQQRVLIEADQRLRQAQQALQSIITMIGEEQGIPEQERHLWKFSDDGKFLERQDEPKMTTPKKKK